MNEASKPTKKCFRSTFKWSIKIYIIRCCGHFAIQNRNTHWQPYAPQWMGMCGEATIQLEASIFLPFHLKAFWAFLPLSFVLLFLFYPQSSKSHLHYLRMKSMARVIECMHIKLLIRMIGSILNLFQEFQIFATKLFWTFFFFCSTKKSSIQNH